MPINQKVKLLVTTESGAARNVAVEFTDERPSVGVGRADDADVKVRSPSVAAKHCRLKATEDAVFLEGLDAPVLRNSQPVRAATPLNDGDRIQLGNVSLRVQFESQVSVMRPGFGGVSRFQPTSRRLPPHRET